MPLTPQPTIEDYEVVRSKKAKIPALVLRIYGGRQIRIATFDGPNAEEDAQMFERALKEAQVSIDSQVVAQGPAQE